MNKVRVSDPAYVRLRVPSLDKETEFLTNFGLTATERLGNKQYLRPSDPVPYCYVVEEGPQKFLGFAFNANSRDDLETLSREHAAPIERIDAPGGGERVRLKEPNGYDVDVVFGIGPAAPIEVKRQRSNTGSEPLARKNELYRIDRSRPSPIKRLAHVVIASPQVTETVDWFVSALGMIVSDHIRDGPNKEVHVGSFIRVDQGDRPVDHHSVFIIRSNAPGLHHMSFEVADFDAVLADHHFLKRLERYEHLWGVGRHLLGSQIYDYWADPFGYAHEHWADSDRLTADIPTNEWLARDGMVSQWGQNATEAIKKRAVP
jgi:catechol 2,3-dioxygenase-like lactoylglutathione lyase family enzyme